MTMKISTPIAIRGMRLRNRIVRSSTAENMADVNGRPTGQMVEFYRVLARGGAGLIVTGGCHVLPAGGISPYEPGLHSRQNLDGFRALAAAVKSEGAEIVCQLFHPGWQLSPFNARTQEALGPVRRFCPNIMRYSRALNRDEIKSLIRSFADGARSAREAGFDGVQINAAHGWLFSQFLSPRTNTRDDEWGGSIAGRAKFLLEALKLTRDMVGDDFPVMVKLNGSDGISGGLDPESAAKAARLLEDNGAGAVEVSGGMMESDGGFGISKGSLPGDLALDLVERGLAFFPYKTPLVPLAPIIMSRMCELKGEGYNLQAAREIKKAVGIPVFVGGGMRSLEFMERALSDSGLDLVSLSRPLVREPDLPVKFLNGESNAARCDSCNRCLAAVGLQLPLACYHDIEVDPETRKP